MELAISEQRLSSKAQWIILAVAAAQGIGLYWLQLSVEDQWWPANSGASIAIAALWLVFIPSAFALSFRLTLATRPYWLALSAMLVVLVPIGFYFGLAHDQDAFREGGGAAVIAGMVFWFIVLFWFKAALHERTVWPSYASMFGFSWHVFLCITLASLFSLITFGVLMLWGALFEVINIGFFSELFARPWIMWPAMMLAFSYALILFRTQINAVGAVQRILRALFSILLPVLGLVATLFVLFLPVTGVELIWTKGYGSSTILLFIAIVLFLFNAVFQDAQQPPYGALATRIVRAIPLALLVLAGLAIYGVGLRVQQYGLTVDRLWALVLVVLLSAYTGACALSSLQRSPAWEKGFGLINRALAVTVAVVCLLLITPMNSLDKVSIASQLKRLEAGQVAVADFDFAYLARLGEPGKRALEGLASSAAVANDPLALARIDEAIETNGSVYRRHDRKTEAERQSLAESFVLYPSESSFNLDVLLDKLVGTNLDFCSRTLPCVIISLDLDGNDEEEQVLLTPNAKGGYHASRIVEYAPGFYDNVGYINVEIEAKDLLDAIRRGDIATPPSPWKNLQIGEQVIGVGEP